MIFHLLVASVQFIHVGKLSRLTEAMFSTLNGTGEVIEKKIFEISDKFLVFVMTVGAGTP